MTSVAYDFSCKTVLVTGAATGIGRATARAFAKAGANVVIGDVDPRADETVELITKDGGRAISQRTDVTHSDQVKALVERAVAEDGGLDIAFNNAGLLPPTAPLVEQTEADWRKVMAVDVTGVFLAMKHQLAHMV